MMVLGGILSGFLRGLVRNRSNLLWMVLLPLVFLLVFIGIPERSFHGTVVGVVDQDHTPVSGAIAQQLARLPDTRVQAVNAGDARHLLQTSQVTVILTLPPGMTQRALAGQPLRLGWDVAPDAGAASGADSSQLALDLRAWLTAGETAVRAATQQHTTAAGGPAAERLQQAFVQGMARAAATGTVLQPITRLTVSGQAQTTDISDAQRAVIGLGLMFIVFTVFGSTGHLLQLFASGSWDRLLASPTPRWLLITSYALCFFIVGWLQYAILYAGARWLIGVAVPLGAMQVLILTLFILAICGLALCVSTLVRSVELHMAAGSFIAVATSMLSGAYWPVDIEPGWMQHLAWFMPQSWALQGFRAAAAGLGFTSAVWLSVGVLAVFALAFFAAGVLRLSVSRTRI